MTRKFLAVAVFSVVLVTACGNGNDSAETVPEPSPENDEISFRAVDSDSVFDMAPDGTNIHPRSEELSSPPSWDDARQVISLACGLTEDAPIEVVSPSGAALGPLDDTNWVPEISKNLPLVALACGRDDDGTVLLVSEIETAGEQDGWSRSGRGELSDRIEIIVISADGSVMRELTSNKAGDWLPRWSPNGEQLTFESNRDGNSEIYVTEVNSTDRWRLTDNEARDQTPVWSRDGFYVAFTSDRTGQFEIHVVEGSDATPVTTRQTGHPFPWWR